MTELFEAPADELDAFEAPEDELDSTAVFEAPEDELDTADTGQSRLANVPGQAAQGFAQFAGPAISAIGRGAKRFYDSPLGWLGGGAIKLADMVIPDEALKSATGSEHLIDIPAKLYQEAGEKLPQQAAEAVPFNPAYSEEWMAGKVPQIAGQIAGVLTSLAATRGAGSGALAPRLAQAIDLSPMFLVGSESGYQEADRQGVTDQAKRDAMALTYGVAEAGVEAIGGFGSTTFGKRALGEALKQTGESTVRRLGKTIASETIEEPITGEAQDIAANVFGGGPLEAPPSMDLTDPEVIGRRLEEAATGAIGGTMFGGVDALIKSAPRPEIEAAHTAANSAEAAGMTQTAQALRDLAAKAQAKTGARKDDVPQIPPSEPLEGPLVESEQALTEIQNVPRLESEKTNPIDENEVRQLEEDLREMPQAANDGPPLLSELQGGIPSGVERAAEQTGTGDDQSQRLEKVPTDSGSPNEGQREELLESVPTEREADQTAVPSVRESGQPDASPGLQQAAPSGVVLPETPSGASREAEQNSTEESRVATADPFSAPAVETPLPPETAAIAPQAESPAASEIGTIPSVASIPVEPVAQPDAVPPESNPFASADQAPDLEAARAAATRPNTPDSTSRARPLKDELGGAAQDYAAFTDADMQARAKDIVDAAKSVENMARLLASEDGVRSLGLSPDLQTYVQAETLKRAVAAVDTATNDVDRIRATAVARKLRAIWDVTRTEAGQALSASKLAGASMRDAIPAMSVDKAIETQQKATIDPSLPVDQVTNAVAQSGADAGARVADELAAKIEANERAAAPSAPADQAAKIAVIQAQIDAYFEGNTPKRVRVIYDPAGEAEAQLNNGVIEVNAAAVGDVSTADVARLLEHEIGHELFKDPAMRAQFNALWSSLDPLARAEIENEVAERYSAAERNEEASVRALDSIRAATRSPKAQTAWEKFKATVARLWQKFTGSMPKDPEALAARMIEVGVQRMRADAGAAGVAMSKRTDLLKNRSPDLAKLLNSIRSKIKPGAKWKDIFTGLPSEQQKWEQEVYDRIRRHEALQDLTPEESQQLTRELSNTWLRERNRLFQQELKKQLAKVSDVKAPAAEKVKASAPRLLQLINLGALDSEAFRDAVAQEWGIANLNSEEARRVKDLGVRAQQAPEGVPRRKLEQQFVEGLQDLTKLSKLEILENWWTAAVLSGWRTHADIMLSVANGIEDVGLGAIVTAFRTGNPDVALRAIGKVIGNLPTAIQEALHHITTGDRSMMRNYDAEVQAALQDGHKMMSNAGRELLRQGGLAKAPGAFMELVARLLTAWDHINSTSTFEGAKIMALARHPDLYEQALKIGPRERDAARAQARTELTAGSEPATKAERLQENARVKEILDKDLPTEVIAQATEIGRDAALQGEPTGLGHAVWELSRQLGRIPEKGVEAIEKSGANNAAARLVLAALRRTSTISRVLTGSKFVRTAGHALNRQLSYVPGIGLLRFAEGSMQGAKADILLAKQLLGTAVGLALLAAFRSKDDDEEGIEGSWKGLTAAQKSALYAAGKQPNSVWYRDDKGKIVSFNFNQWGIAGVLGTLGAMEDQRRYHGNDNDLSILINGIVTGSMQFSEKAQLQGLQQVLGGDSAYSTSANVTDGLAKRLNRYAATTVGGLVPRIAKDVDAVVSPELRKVDEWWQQWAAQVPMLRELSSGKRVDILGRDVTIDRGPLSRVVQTGTDDGAYRILGRMNERDLWLPDPSTGVRVVRDPNGERRDMSPEEKDRYQRATGAAYKAFVIEHGDEILAMELADAKDYITKQTKIIREEAAKSATQQ